MSCEGPASLKYLCAVAAFTVDRCHHAVPDAPRYPTARSRCSDRLVVPKAGDGAAAGILEVLSGSWPLSRGRYRYDYWHVKQFEMCRINDCSSVLKRPLTAAGPAGYSRGKRTLPMERRW